MNLNNYHGIIKITLFECRKIVEYFVFVFFQKLRNGIKIFVMAEFKIFLLFVYR